MKIQMEMMQIIIMMKKIGDRNKRRRKNLHIYKIQDANTTISMLRLLLYW
jgi:hypothetical protein